MFTGIITHIGKVESVQTNKEKDLLLEISLQENQIERSLDIGCSIACNGICLTLVNKDKSDQKITLSFQASKETCNKTTLESWKINDAINLEFALRAGDELGGHIVSGHVDSIGKIIAINNIDESHQFIFEADQSLMKFIVDKGSITINGVSLTVNKADKNQFSINIIPHTFENTNFKNLEIGNIVNLEIDTIARYLSKIIAKND